MSNYVTVPRVVIGAASSGSGKTLITCALLRILLKSGLKPASFKCGPDYIDPMFHRSVLNIPSRNLDLFLAGDEGVNAELLRGSAGMDIVVIEGVMGFYDGIKAASTKGSAYDIARVTGTPTILVVNCRGMSNSVIPVIEGFCNYTGDSPIKGIILNNLSNMIAEDLIGAIEDRTGVPAIGYLPVIRDLNIASRHLGLIMPSEIEDILSEIDKVADELQKHLKLEKLLEIAGTADRSDRHPDKEMQTEIVGPANSFLGKTAAGEGKIKNRIGVAIDEAFCFYYEANLDLLREMGAEIVFFSPIHDSTLPDVSGLIIGGGYPELHARELSDNVQMRNSIKRAAMEGIPILAECGGFLYLQEELTDTEGNAFEMVGFFDGKGHYTGKLSHFGYVNVTAEKDNPYLKEGEVMRAHEFHYYDTSCNGDVCLMRKPWSNRSWMGYNQKQNVFGGFAHFYYPSCRAFTERFLNYALTKSAVNENL